MRTAFETEALYPWVDVACADYCVFFFWSLVVLLPRLPPSSRSLRLFPRARFASWALGHLLGSLARGSPSTHIQGSPRQETSKTKMLQSKGPSFVSRKRGLLEKGAFQKSPFSREFRDCRDSRDSKETPDRGKQRRIRPTIF